MEQEQKVSVMWTYDDKILTRGSGKDNLSRVCSGFTRKLRSSIGTTVTGFKKAVTTSSMGECTHFYAHPYFQGQEWYDWALFHFEEHKTHGDLIESKKL